MEHVLRVAGDLPVMVEDDDRITFCWLSLSFVRASLLLIGMYLNKDHRLGLSLDRIWNRKEELEV